MSEKEQITRLMERLTQIIGGMDALAYDVEQTKPYFRKDVHSVLDAIKGAAYQASDSFSVANTDLEGWLK